MTYVTTTNKQRYIKLRYTCHAYTSLVVQTHTSQLGY